MAGKRKVGNLLALAVLSTVYQRPMHRYEMASIMRARNKDQDMQVKWGSLYTVVDNLAKHGYVEVVGSDRQGARPERTIFAITEAGRRELVEWTRELISSPETEHPQFAAGLSVMVALPPDEVIELLQLRLASVQRKVAGRREAIAVAVRDVPRLFLIEEEYLLAVDEAEASWIVEVVAEMIDGRYPDLDRWRAWHAGGEFPPDLAELAERGAVQD